MRSQNGQKGFVAYALPIAGAVCLLAGLMIGFMHGSFTGPSYALVGLGTVLFLSIFIRAERSNLLYYFHVMFYSVLVGAICVGLYLFAKQYDTQIDLTKGKLHSLSEATVKYLKGLEQPVTITIFTPQTEPFAPLQQLYESESPKVKFEYVDSVKNPLAAKNMGEKVGVGDIFVQSEGNKQKLNMAELPQDFVEHPVVAENTFTNAIMQVTRKTKPKLYFLTGHGEVSFETIKTPPSQDRKQAPIPSLGALRKALEERGMQTAELDLAKEGSIPTDATVVVIAGPKRDVFEAEFGKLESYLKGGGKLLVLLDPQISEISSPQENIKKLIAEYGIEAPDSVIFDDADGQLLGIDPPLYPIMSIYDPSHPITKLLVGGGMMPVVALTRPLEKGNVSPDMQYTELVKSTPASWTLPIAELSGGHVTRPPKNSYKPATFGVAVGKTAPPQLPGVTTPRNSTNNTRLVVYGSSLLIHDGFLSGNNTGIILMYNTIDWLAGAEDMIAIPPRQAKGVPIILTKNQQGNIFLVCVILIPALLFFGGLSYTIVRRQR